MYRCDWQHRHFQHRSRRRRRLIGIWRACGLAALALWAAYARLSQTYPTNSDGAGNALQAWQMLPGNPLLRGWVLSDVSFSTTELPQYMAVALAPLPAS